ncbi:hypothetical protein OK349_09070 [Sphingomonas sp. BT-65]|uniref:hypothetical protein n=1 Tax=Sphingomonas sp. BT-65 TaxID=2989821 RepID=UPI002235CD31|nr:hypothetical protein [Sphingomonas sp. BT-65]MCW4461861.1 hypothetical protein [Sphingomonas sp. BT-65]
MIEGFVLTERHDMPVLPGWSPGVPRKGWFGVKQGKDKPIEITTWRCQRCGFLENYART